MLKFRKDENKIILIYSGETNDTSWIYQKLYEVGFIKLQNTFKLEEKHLEDTQTLAPEDELNEVSFVLAKRSGEYYKFDRKVLCITNNLYIHKDFMIDRKTFIAERKISVFSRLDALVTEDIYIGGAEFNAIPESVFISLLKKFPNSYELKKYTQARIDAMLTNYINTKEDSQQQYLDYMNKKESKVGSKLQQHFASLEVYRSETILEKLKDMLDDENAYSEKQWQQEILEIILLLYPKYIHVFSEVSVRDTYNSKNRSIDFLLIDSTGNTDIIEIKKPFDQCIVTQRTYRDNYIPLRELSGTVMQVEKYIFYLNKWGKRGEDRLTEKYRNELIQGLKIHITNPGGIIIMGRDLDLSFEQKQDFEVIKRKYKNIIDIITYDDLIGRLELMLQYWQTFT